ncbi:hypothetical protein [Massilia sp. TWR1-2-2]|uniref:hypothetical protein n=1 Tax=Massilia sp. TWR1-2-2 TaxID=2804584 RepID=UPI003CF52BEC
MTMRGVLDLTLMPPDGERRSNRTGAPLLMMTEAPHVGVPDLADIDGKVSRFAHDASRVRPTSTCDNKIFSAAGSTVIAPGLSRQP